MSERWCEDCQGLGTVNCYCGGDLCVCLNYGEKDCPTCGGSGGEDDDFDLDFEPGASA
jgi:hypothetical protein